VAVGPEKLACVPVEQPDEAQRVDQDAGDSETCLGPQAQTIFSGFEDASGHLGKLNSNEVAEDF
jgi:hypothetical protein